MFNRAELLREVEVALCDREGSLKQRLVVAAEHFWAAQLFENDWPEPLQKRAEGLCRELVSSGTVAETIGAMDEDSVVELASRIVDLLEAGESDSAQRPQADCQLNLS